MFSINDELQDFKARIKSYGIHILKFEKVGNGNMAAFKMQYRLPSDHDIREDFFWRHDLDVFEKKIKEAVHRVQK